MEDIVRLITWCVVLLTICDTTYGRFRRPTAQRIYRNVARIRTKNTRDYVNLHMAEVAEITEPFHGRDLRTSVDHIRASVKRMQSSDCNPHAIYRTIDGSCNNLYHPMWGTPMRKQLRLVRSRYDDGIQKPRLYRNQATPLPSARVVSQACFPYDSTNTVDTRYSMVAMQWGQFLDHDITGTPESNNTKDCCAEMRADGTHPDYSANGDCFPIHIEAGDRFFTKNCMEFRRSMAAEKYEKREQLNIITAYIDASNIYGSSLQEVVESRSFVGGLLKEGEYNILPLNATIERPCKKSDIGSCYFSGDVRVNEIPGLTSFHALFHREHNRIAKKLAIINPLWDDETLFQETRKIIAAYMQIITYKEFLPIVMGEAGMRRYGLNRPYQYTSGVNPEILNSFSTAAYRFGHSMIDRTFKTLRNPRQNIEDMYFSPSFNRNGEGKGYDYLLEGIISLPCQKSDKFFNKGVSDHLFKDIPAPGVSFDLAARNIQRGRDHGLPPFTVFRAFAEKYYRTNRYRKNNRRDYITGLGDRLNRKGFRVPSTGTRIPGRRYAFVRGKRALRQKSSFSSQCLNAYNNQIGDVDLFVGGMSEDHVDGGILGKTFAAIIGIQFYRLKNSDRFWYETTNTKIGFTRAQLAELRNATLARIMCDNSNVPHIQKEVFKLPGKNNPVTDCNNQDIPEINLNLWKDLTVMVNK